MGEKKAAHELWRIFKERLSPTDLKALISLLIDSDRRRIEKTQLIASALVLFKNDEFLKRCFTDFLTSSQEKEDEDKGPIEAEADKSLMDFCKKVSEELGPSELLKLVSSIKDFDKQTISLSQFRESLPPLFKNNGQPGKTPQNVEDTDLQLEDRLGIRAKVGEKSKEDGADADQIRVSEERELVEEVTHGFNKMGLDGKKRRILQPEPPSDERSLKKTRKSTRLERVTPSYKLFPEEERCPVSSNHVLNNKYSLVKFDDPSGHKRLTKYEEAMARCEDYMFETDVLMGNLRSAVESAEKVIKEEMSVEDLGVMFYRCIEKLYRGDMSEFVREDHKRALPVILKRLKQKLDELTVVRESWKPRWKQVFAENTAKQRESIAQGNRNRVKENSKF